MRPNKPSPSPAFREVLTFIAQPCSPRSCFTLDFPTGIGHSSTGSRCPGACSSHALRPHGHATRQISRSRSCPRNPSISPCSTHLVKSLCLKACPTGHPPDHVLAPSGGIAQSALLRQLVHLPRAINRSRHLAWASGSIPSYDLWLRSPLVIPGYDPQLRSHRQIQCLDSVYPGIVGNSLCQPADSPCCDRLFKTSCVGLWFDPELQSRVTIAGFDPFVRPSASKPYTQAPLTQCPSHCILRRQEPAAWDWDVMLIFRSGFCSGEQKEEDCQLGKDAMESTPGFTVPLKVEVMTGRTWAECK